jgi:hypothetical protein
MRRRTARSFRPQLDRLDDRCLPAALTPAQVTAAYGLNAVTFTVNGQSIKANGAGQVIAIVDAYHDPYLASDLHTFDQAYGLADPALVQVNLAGSATDDGWAGEETLDVEWAHAVAPGAAILVVEARSDSLNDLISAVAFARSVPKVSVISMSWGSSEFSSQTAYDSYFTTPAGHTGITFIAASGDEGAFGGAEWPASSANVLSVGGTSLNVSSSGSYLGESLWNGSSGGASVYVSEPSYQYTLQSSGRRTTPDVAFDGDPNTGVMVYTTNPSNGRGSWEQVGGTSVGAPAWAGIVAMADEIRWFAGRGTLDGATQTLPELYSLPSTDFHKIASVSYRFFRQSVTVTAGLGTPNGAALIYGLAYGTTTARAKATIAAVTSTSTTTTRGITAALATGQTASFATATTTQTGPGSQRPAQSSAVAVLDDTEPAVSVRTADTPTARPASLLSFWKSLFGTSVQG